MRYVGLDCPPWYCSTTRSSIAGSTWARSQIANAPESMGCAGAMSFAPGLGGPPRSLRSLPPEGELFAPRGGPSPLTSPFMSDRGTATVHGDHLAGHVPRGFRRKEHDA